MNWIELTGEEQLDIIRDNSYDQPQVIFKHSTRCSLSSMAKNRLERYDSPCNLSFYYLDLIRYRSLSNKIEEQFQVHHESPQVLVIREGECIYEESHNGISIDEILHQLKN